jgi:sigma-E factor negative regulatory protein RseB
MQRGVRQGWRWVLPWLCLLTLAAQAQDRSAAGAEADVRSAEQWLQIVQQAARRLDYVGTVVYQQGDEVRMSRIVHIFDGQVSRERLQPMDGRPREFIRNDDEVKCLIPESRRVVVERRARQDAFPALTGAATSELLQHYQVQVVNRERAGGFDAQVIEIRPRQGDRYGYRLWVDRGTGLLLRSQTLGERGEMLEQMAFAEIRIGGVDRGSLKPSWSTDGWKIDETTHKPVDLRGQGWRVSPPEGFKALYAVRRPMPSGPALQAVYSDGLATFSVFIEPATGAARDEPMPQRGPISAYVRRVGDSTVTVVGEVPPATSRAVAYGADRIAR